MISGWPRSRSTLVLRFDRSDYVFAYYIQHGSLLPYPKDSLGSSIPTPEFTLDDDEIRRWSEIEREFMYRESQQQMLNEFFERWRIPQKEPIIIAKV